jgi:hypothetical protein
LKHGGGLIQVMGARSGDRIDERAK